MRLINVLLLFSIFSVLIAGCRLETAKPSLKQYLLVATDCLNSKDHFLFKSFEKQSGIKVRILHLSTDEIVAKLKAEIVYQKYLEQNTSLKTEVGLVLGLIRM